MRVIALTSDPSLTVALNMMDDWEVIQVTDAQGAVEKKSGAAALVIGADSTDAGLTAAESAFSQGLTLPIVVVGDAEGPTGARATVVSRPFSLDDLREAVDRAMKAAPGAGAPVPSELPTAPSTTEAEQSDVPSGRPTLGSLSTPVAPGRGSANGIDLAEVKVPEPVEEPEPEPERPPLQVAPEPKQEAAAPPAAAPAPAPPKPSTPSELPAPPPATPSPAPPPEAHPEPPARAPARREDRTIAAVAEPERARPKKERKRGMFGRRSRPAPEPAEESPLQRKIRAATTGVGAIQDVLEELPILGDVEAMSVAILGEVVEMFRPEAASIYVLSGDRFHIVASHGLSKVERKMTLRSDHGLLAELSRKGDAMLIAPVDLAQGLVAGVAGTHTEALLAAPMMVGRSCVACIIVGRNDFADSDLEALDALAREAGAGLGIARLLSELRRLADG